MSTATNHSTLVVKGWANAVLDGVVTAIIVSRDAPPDSGLLPVLVLPLSPSGEPTLELIDSISIDEIAERLGMGSGAWDMVPPRDIVAAVLTALCSAAQEGKP